MVIFFPVILKQLFHLGRFFPWPKPERCPRCGSHRLWGHGFVAAYFDGFDQGAYPGEPRHLIRHQLHIIRTLPKRVIF